ncbi:hypothetical protein K1719_014509 [Acacia pycnantha]|nr:hypothetical protein K1719_014509 [Acacia pycnantha]
MAGFASQISFVLLFLLFATTFKRSVVTSNKVIRCHENDQRLLLIFKQGVVEDSCNYLSSWTVEHDCCLWEGVYCDHITGRVIELSLSSGYVLGGEINLCVLQLEFLNHLNLSRNNFKTVSMPPCQISKSPFDAHKFHNQSLATSNHSSSFSIALRYLDFSYNSYLVINDLQWLSQLSSLKYLDLSGNDIGNETKWLHYMAMLPSLSELYLRFCELRDFPSLDYTNFTSLEVLDLSFNYDMRSKLPNSFFNITNRIYDLDLEKCGFYGQLPKAFLNLQSLKYLDLNYNNLEGSITNWLGQYERLQYLDIRRNFFNGEIPSSLGNISSLFHLDLSFNRFSGNIPETLGRLHNLNHLHIGHNSLVGVVTEKKFSNFSNLTSLDLGSTGFKFDIDPKWVPPFQLETLDLGNARIGPNVPTWLYTQRSLGHLNISACGISKIDATVFWRFVAGIMEVDLSNNLISDDISNVILSGNISRFDASHNSLSGSFSSLLCHVDNNTSTVLNLDLSNNLLSGALPNDCWPNFRELEHLNLGSNKLTGKVPPSIASLKFLSHLDLSHNSFFGKISFDLSNWTLMNYLILERNKFSGTLPNTMQQSLYIIKLRGNQFIGNIPSQLCNLNCLTILDLAENKFSGPIPQCLHKIMQPAKMYDYLAGIEVFDKGKEMYYEYFTLVNIIDLSTNNLSGEIPKELFNLTQMRSLNLSRNHLIGKVPEEIGGMKVLDSLDLSYNKLSGEIPSTISSLSFLSFLNLSYNNFIGQIPLGTQIQSFDSWSFVGNVDLCGDPLPQKCHKKDASDHPKLVEDDDFLKSLYLGMGVGFAAGCFWGVCGSLFILNISDKFSFSEIAITMLIVALTQILSSAASRNKEFCCSYVWSRTLKLPIECHFFLS